MEEKGRERKRQQAKASSWSVLLVIRKYNEQLQYAFFYLWGDWAM